MESTQFITDVMLDAWINEAYEELWDLVASAFADHFWTTSDFTLTSTEAGAKFTLPATFRQLRFVERNPGTSSRVRIPRWAIAEKNRLPSLSYRLVGTVLEVDPYEDAAGPYRIYYVDNPTSLVLATDTVDARVDTWREFIVILASIKARTKEESDTADLRADLDRVRKRIEEASQHRDASDPGRVSDVWDGDPLWPPPWRV